MMVDEVWGIINYPHCLCMQFLSQLHQVLRILANDLSVDAKLPEGELVPNKHF